MGSAALPSRQSAVQWRDTAAQWSTSAGVESDDLLYWSRCVSFVFATMHIFNKSFPARKINPCLDGLSLSCGTWRCCSGITNLFEISRSHCDWNERSVSSPGLWSRAWCPAASWLSTSTSTGGTTSTRAGTDAGFRRVEGEPAQHPVA